jgi:hypothetical protein
MGVRRCVRVHVHCAYRHLGRAGRTTQTTGERVCEHAAQTSVQYGVYQLEDAVYS